jgi:hypothetical protein
MHSTSSWMSSRFLSNLLQTLLEQLNNRNSSSSSQEQPQKKKKLQQQQLTVLLLQQWLFPSTFRSRYGDRSVQQTPSCIRLAGQAC